MPLGEKLGKLSIAILENFVEDKLGKKFVDELRAPTDRAMAVATAPEHAEDRFKKEFDDKELAHAMFVDLPAAAPSVLLSAGKFYDHPTDPDFQQNLEKILTSEFKNISKERVKTAVDFYLEILTEELALADETFRENARALSDLRVVQILKRVEQHLANQSSVNQEQFALRSLHQLPPAPADFTGREEQLQQVVDALAQHKGAAISGLTGMGGIGKTALGLVAAHRIESQYPDAQIFLDLKGVTEPLSASDALRHVILSFEPQADLREANEDGLAALYQSLLTDKKVLVFMDNARNAAQVQSLILPESCALIVTSRLNFSLPNMNPLKLNVLPENQAIDLLHELCKRIGGTAKDIAELCGYLPLALRIAGTFLAEHNDWTPKEYAERLKAKRLSALKGEEQDERFDLENVLGESYEQLTQDEQKYWRMLAVFPASFKREGGAAVWELDEDATRDVLSKFNRMSLLDYDKRTERYSLHDLLAEFSNIKLSDEENLEASLHHAKYFMNVAEVADNLYCQGGEKVMQGLGLLDAEWTHIQAGQKWAVANMNIRKEIVELVMLYPNASESCLHLRLLSRKLIDWLISAVDVARLLDRKDFEATHLGGLGTVYRFLGEMREAIKAHEQALEMLHAIGDFSGEASNLGNLGRDYFELGYAGQAIPCYEKALTIFRTLGDRQGEANSIGHIGMAYHVINENLKAVENIKKALAITQEIGDRKNEASWIGCLGLIHESSNDPTRALKQYDKALAITQEIGDRLNEGIWLGNIANTHYQSGHKRKAMRFTRQALAIFEAIESPYAQKARDLLKEWG